MAGNRLIELVEWLIRQIDTRVARHVRLTRIDPDTPPEPADGWALTVGTQRLGLGGGGSLPSWPRTALAGAGDGWTISLTVFRQGALVTLRGWASATAPASGSVVAELPEWARPAGQASAVTMAEGNRAVGSLSVQTAGQIRYWDSYWTARPSGNMRLSACWEAA